MDLEEAKKILENEVKDVHTNVQCPFNCKYATWKIIDYLWTCNLEGGNWGTYMDWLYNLYEEAGMSEKSMKTFRLEIELLTDVIERNPLKSK